MRFFESKSKMLTRLRLLNTDMYMALKDHNQGMIVMTGAKEGLMFIEMCSNSQQTELSIILDKIAHAFRTHNGQAYTKYAHDLINFLNDAYKALKFVSVNHLKLQMDRPFPMRCVQVNSDYKDVMENSSIMQEALSNLIANLGGTMDMNGYDSELNNEIQRAKKLRTLLNLQDTSQSRDYLQKHPMNWLISTRGY